MAIQSLPINDNQALFRRPSSPRPTGKTVQSNIFFVFAGKTHCLFLEYDLTIKELKYQFCRHLRTNSVCRGYGYRDLSMVFQGKPLDDDMTLDNYLSISGQSRNNVTIHVWVRQPGGCFMISAFVLFLIISACVASVCTCGCSLLVIPFLLPLLFILPLFCL